MPGSRGRGFRIRFYGVVGDGAVVDIGFRIASDKDSCAVVIIGIVRAKRGVVGDERVGNSELMAVEIDDAARAVFDAGKDAVLNRKAGAVG